MPSTSIAAEPPPRVHFEYRAPAECPPEEEFVSELRTRTKRFEQVDPGEASRVVRVTLAEAPDATFSGEVEMRETTEAAPRVLRRQLGANLCSELVSAVAVVIAIALDPDALSSEPTADPVAPTRPKARTEPARRRPIVSAKPRPREATTGFIVSGVAGVGAMTALAPGPSPTLELGGDFRRWGVGGFEPAFRATLVGSRGFASGQEGEAEFRLGALRLEACPLRTGEGSSISADLCASIEAGVISARGTTEPAIVRERSRLWFAAGIIAHARGAIGAGWFIEPSVGPLFPVTRDRYFLRTSSRTLHEVPAIGGRGTLAIGTKFE